MGKPNIKLNRAEVRRLLRSPEAMADLKARGGRIAMAAGPGFEIVPSVGRNRARVAVVAATKSARRAEAKSGVLSKALDAGRG